MRTILAALMAATGWLVLSASANAHHSFTVEYDPMKPVEGSGVISKVEWTNPHMRVYIDVTGTDGKVTTWNLELGAVNSVLRRGWKPSDLAVGSKITFKGSGGRKILTRAVADALTLADGRAFTGASGAPDAPSR
jgi:hypothetical protein